MIRLYYFRFSSRSRIHSGRQQCFMGLHASFYGVLIVKRGAFRHLNSHDEWKLQRPTGLCAFVGWKAGGRGPLPREQHFGHSETSSHALIAPIPHTERKYSHVSTVDIPVQRRPFSLLNICAITIYILLSASSHFQRLVFCG